MLSTNRQTNKQIMVHRTKRASTVKLTEREKERERERENTHIMDTHRGGADYTQRTKWYSRGRRPHDRLIY